MQYGIIFKIERKNEWENKFIVEKIVKGYWNVLDVLDDVLSSTTHGIAFAFRNDELQYDENVYRLDTNIMYAVRDEFSNNEMRVEQENLFYDNKYLPDTVKAEVGKELEILTHTWD
jgi:hypothetical protein